MKYFTPAEFRCRDGCGAGYKDMNPQTLEKLDRARSLAGVAFSITSAYRCDKHNEAVGGKPNSAHTRGHAVDIKVMNSAHAWLVLTALIAVGFDRIGYNSRTKFFHVDDDPSLPAGVFFDY